MIAIARIFLDNFPHIQASWFSEGKKIGQIALSFGADDFGGVLEEENVHASANFVHTTSVKETVDLIRSAGYTPAERTTLYDIISRIWFRRISRCRDRYRAAECPFRRKRNFDIVTHPAKLAWRLPFFKWLNSLNSSHF